MVLNARVDVDRFLLKPVLKGERTSVAVASVQHNLLNAPEIAVTHIHCFLKIECTTTARSVCQSRTRK